MYRTNKLIVALLIMSGVVGSPLEAGLNEWTSRGPEKGGSITRIVVAADDDDLAYAASYGGGVYRSENGGQLWRAVSQGLSDWRITDLAISPDDPRTLYASAGVKIYKTTTGGEVWVEIYHDATDQKLNGVRLLALRNRVVLASTTFGRLLRSTDGGSSWRVSTLPCSGSVMIEASPWGTVICRGSHDNFSSDDGGASWRSIEGIPVAGRRSFAFGADGSTYVSNSQAVFRSENGRTGWQRFADFPSTPGFRQVSDIHISRSGILFAAINGEAWAFRSGSWIKVVDDPEAGIRSFAAANPLSERIYAASGRHGVFVGMESDSSWRVAAQGMKNAWIRDVAVSPFDPSLVFAAGTSELFRSDDPAGSWQELAFKAWSWVTVSPAQPNVAYASDARGLLRTTDRGESWSVIRSGSVSELTVAPSDPATLYAAFVDRGVAKSTDGGESWSMAMSNMPMGSYAFWYGFSADITVDPRDSSTVYAGHEAGLYKTTNGGASWTSLSSAGARVVVEPRDPATLFGLFPIRSDWGWGGPTALSRSHDGGTTWKRLSLPDELITDVIIDPSAAGVVYASSELAVYRSSDYGETWSSFSHGLHGPVIRRLAIDASGHYLFAGTMSGVYEYEISAVDLAPVPAAGWNLTELLEQLVQSGTGSAAGFVLPVVGLVEGGSGLYRTAVTISNGRPIAQQVVIAWLPEGGGPVSFFKMTLPAAGPGSTDTFAVPDVMRRLGLEGLGTMVAVAIDGGGEFDSAASIGGAATICAYRFDRNPACHSVPAARTGVFRPHLTATATGLRHDSEARTNIGITNLDGRSHRYTVNAIGEQTRQTFVIDVPPFSLIQRTIPPGTYGALTLEVSTDDPSAPWLFYGSTVEIRSGVSVTHLGTP